VRPGDLGLRALLVCRGAASAELTHRTGQQEGLAWDVYAIWDLPVALLPPLYSLLISLPRVAHRVANPPHPGAVFGHVGG
jgi:hypothetical protein